MTKSINWRRAHGYIVAAVIIAMPLLLWLSGVNLSDAFASPGAAIKALGKAAALSAIVAYALLPILSVRYTLIMNIFGGLDVAFRIHKKLGKLLAFLILAHPLLLIVGGLLQGHRLSQVWDWSSLVVLSGALALICFLIIISITLYAKIQHHRWIFVHRLFGWLLPLMMVHALLAQSRVVQQRALFYYVTGFFLLGFAAFLYRSVFAEIFIKKFHYQVAEVNNVHETVAELVLRPVGIPMSYEAGQFAYLSLISEAVDKEPHPFSFTTANNGPYIRFAIKALGDYSTNIRGVAIGDDAYMEGPYGNFSYLNTKNKKQVWIAGGVGITPFLSMARSLSKNSPYQITLFYAAEELDDAVFLRELLQIRKSIPNVLTLFIVNRKTSGFISIETLTKELSVLSEYDYFICGPPAMAIALKTKLREKQVPQTHLHIEEFSML